MMHPRPNLLIPAAIALLLGLAMAVLATDFEWISSGGRGHVRTNAHGSVMSRSVYTNASLIMPGSGLGFAGTNQALRNYAPGRAPLSVAPSSIPVWTNNSYMLFPSTMSEMRHITSGTSTGLTIVADIINPIMNGSSRIAVDLLAIPDWASNGTATTTINILTNGEFDATNGWVTNAGWTISNSTAWFIGSSGTTISQTVAALPTVEGTSTWYTFGATVSISGASCDLEGVFGSTTFTATPPCLIRQTVRNQAATTAWRLKPVNISGGTTTVRVDDAYVVPNVPRQMFVYPRSVRWSSGSIGSLGDVTQTWLRVVCVVDALATNIIFYENALAVTNYIAPCSNTIPAGSFWSLKLYSASSLNQRGVRNWHIFRQPMSSNQVQAFDSWLGAP